MSSSDFDNKLVIVPEQSLGKKALVGAGIILTAYLMSKE
jgi:hypothetical protein